MQVFPQNTPYLHHQTVNIHQYACNLLGLDNTQFCIADTYSHIDRINNRNLH